MFFFSKSMNCDSWFLPGLREELEIGCHLLSGPNLGKETTLKAKLALGLQSFHGAFSEYVTVGASVEMLFPKEGQKEIAFFVSWFLKLLREYHIR